MALVLVDLIILIVIVGLVALVALRLSAKRDTDEIAQQTAEKKERAEQERAQLARHKAGASLICLACNTHFTGPLTESGCPKCHTESLVMTVPEFERRSNQITSSGE